MHYHVFLSKFKIRKKKKTKKSTATKWNISLDKDNSLNYHQMIMIHYYCHVMDKNMCYVGSSDVRHTAHFTQAERYGI